MEREYYTEVEALKDIRGFIIDCHKSCEYYEDLHHNVFNFGYRGGLEALEEYGVFKAIGEVQQEENIMNEETLYYELEEIFTNSLAYDDDVVYRIFNDLIEDNKSVFEINLQTLDLIEQLEYSEYISNVSYTLLSEDESLYQVTLYL